MLITGRKAAAVGGLALLCVVLIGYSEASYDGVTGVLTSLVGGAVAVTWTGGAAQAELRAVGFFDIYETNIRWLLSIVAVALASLSLTMATIAARSERASLWYAVAVLASGTAISAFHQLIGLLAIGIAGALILAIRKGRMTQA